MHGFKSAILEKLKNYQNDTFEPMHEIRVFFFAKSILLKRYENENGNWNSFFHNMSQGPPNPGVIQ